MPCTSTSGLSAATAAMSPTTLAAPRHVALHLAHAGRGLDAEAAGVEGDALADEDELLLGLAWACRPMWTKRGSLTLPCPTAMRSFIPRFSISLRSNTWHLSPRLFGHALRFASETCRVELVGGLVDQIAGQRHRAGHALPDVDRFLVGLAGARLGTDRDGRRRDLGLGTAITGHVFGEPIRAENQAFGHVAQLFGRMPSGRPRRATALAPLAARAALAA